MLLPAILMVKDYCNLIGWHTHVATKSCSLKCFLTLMANCVQEKRTLKSNWARDTIGQITISMQTMISFDSFLDIDVQRIWQSNWTGVTNGHMQPKKLVADATFSSWISSCKNLWYHSTLSSDIDDQRFLQLATLS